MSKIVPEEGDTYKGIYLPPGTAVSCCTFGACRDQKIFGEDANTFRPERWLYDDEAIIKRREATLELVFGQGRWQCLGRHLALMKMRKVIVEVGFGPSSSYNREEKGTDMVRCSLCGDLTLL